jgi:hypothetical protein
MHPSMSSQALQREIEMVRANRYEISDEYVNSSRPHNENGGNKSHNFSQEVFLRSASARLSKKDEDSMLVDGEKKREESMKRLLEWKQRMLQSPLTRKGPQISIVPTNARQTNSLHQPVKSPSNVKGASFYEQKLPVESLGSNFVLQRSRSDTHASSAFNRDSSEEEGELVVNAFDFLFYFRILPVFLLACCKI